MFEEIPDTERALLLNGFPSNLGPDVREAISALPADHMILLVDRQYHFIDSLVSSNHYTIKFDGELLSIPYRIYFNEPYPEKERRLTSVQQAIVHCLYLRHHNGFIRQKRLELLTEVNYDFIIPYTLQLLGEYVMEVLEVLDRLINSTTIDAYLKFINENKKYWQQTVDRMVSYWDAYYRRPMHPHYLPPKYARRKDYIGQQIVDRLKKKL